jgi:hypothetical protein
MGAGLRELCFAVLFSRSASGAVAAVILAGCSWTNSKELASFLHEDANMPIATMAG